MEGSGRGRFEDRVALITGSSSGIGAATARLFAAEGAQVVVTGLEPDLVAAVADDITERGGTAIGLPADLRKPDQLDHLVAATIERFSGVDILVNNAALVAFGGLMDTSEPTWDAIIDVNIRAVVRLSRAVVPHMAKRQKGTIVNIASGLGIQGSHELVAYSATKGAIIALTRSMAADLVGLGIRVNAVSPGSTRTGAAKPGEDRPHAPAIGLPVGYKAEPEEMADVIAFMASDESRYIYGQTIVVDGGRSSVLFPRSSPWR